MNTVTQRARVSVAQRIESALLDEIAAGQIEPGQRLDETRLAERFGASRTLSVRRLGV